MSVRELRHDNPSGWFLKSWGLSASVSFLSSSPPPRSFTCATFLAVFDPGGGDSHMKQTGMLVVSLRGVNFGFWSRLGCSGQSANILSRQGLV